MARRPLLPERATFLLGIMGGLLAWLGGTSVAGSVLPDAGAYIAGVLAGMVALVGIPTLLGRPEAELIRATAGRSRAEAFAFRDAFDPGQARELLERRGVLAVFRPHGCYPPLLEELAAAEAQPVAASSTITAAPGGRVVVTLVAWFVLPRAARLTIPTPTAVRVCVCPRTVRPVAGCAHTTPPPALP